MTQTKKLTLLSALYLAQGLPYGFFTQALPVLLRSANVSLPQIGLANLLTLPWALKFIWAPAADRATFGNLGLRRSWLLPLQALSILLYLMLALVEIDASSLMLILTAFLLTNFLAATQDIATDGLAIDILKPSERGWGNGIQVSGYRIGMIVGGLTLPALYPAVGWKGVMTAMAGIAAACTLPVIFFDEPKFRPLERTPIGRGPLKEMFHFFAKSGTLPWLVVLLLFKFGHASATGMLRPWLVDQNYSIKDIAWILGTGGFVAGFAGAMTGGFLAAKFNRPKLLVGLGCLQVMAVASYLWPVMTEHATYKVLISATLDHFTSGLATTTLFTLMMDASSKDRAASDYTVQACAVVLSQTLAPAFAGFSAETMGYTVHFMISTAIGSLAVLLTFLICRKKSVRELLKPQLTASLVALVILIGFLPERAFAQDSSTNEPYEVGIQFGALLPGRKVRYVREIMEGATLRALRPLSSTSGLEALLFMSNGHGDKYRTFALEYRATVWDDFFPAHVAAGLHADYIAPEKRKTRRTIGWQFGGGMRQPIGESGLSVREDFSYRLGGGTSLLVMLGLSYELR